MAKMKPLPKLVLIAAAVGLGMYGFKQLVYTGVIPRPSILKTVIPLKAEEISATVLDHNVSNVKLVDLPSNTPSVRCEDGDTKNCVNSAMQEIEHWAWNGNAGLDFATGGAVTQVNGKVTLQTSKGSLMEKNGVIVRITRNDDSNVMADHLLNTAQALTSDPNAAGTKFITIMGDGAAAFLAALNPKLAKVCPDCIAEVIATIGYSRGEDSFLGPQAWKDNCESMRGGMTIGVLRDGDWNIALKKLGQCNIPNNPDDKVYDPEAMNWINSDSYTKAAESFVTGVGNCVDLPVKGKINGGVVHKCAQGVVTWTPGDVTVAHRKGGVVPILSTKQSAFQMPTTLVGIRKWNRAHRAEIVKMLAATYAGADQIRANPAAFRKYGEIAAKLYAEQTPEYWMKYYKGVTEQDVTGNMIALGGSSVSNLADAMQNFGLNGGPNLFKATYETFGKIVVQQYPNLVPSYPPVSEILDTSYVKGVADLGTLSTDNAENVLVTSSSKPLTSIEGRKNYSINFAVGSAQILPTSFGVLDQLADEILITKYAAVAHGHTDNTGTPDGNMELSKLRAESVVAYLKGKGVRNVLRSRAHGQEDPIGSNDTVAGKAKNRRVEIVLGAIE